MSDSYGFLPALGRFMIGAPFMMSGGQQARRL